ncbi:MAG TPA: creatininase family protein, partial [Bacteroidales bacterium]|nr:creatininase family protein [Bacteroidales bacterium]
MKLSDYIVFESLTVAAPVIEKKKITSTYILQKKNGETVSNELTYSFEEDVFNPSSDTHRNLASMMLAQVALNYGLFCDEIIFDGLYDDTDRKFIRDMLENTSREIYVNRLLKPNPFIIESYRGLRPEKMKKYTSAGIRFQDSFGGKPSGFDWKHWDTEREKHCILSSGGKDSLLSYGLMDELGKDVHPIFVNESGRHWFTALNAYRYFKEHDQNTARVWCNSDRIFNWMIRNMPFIRPDFNTVRADDYPIRLWTVAVFIFGVLPLLKKRGIGRLIIGDEFDTTRKLNYEGITHYDGLYDQSRYFDNALSRLFMKKGWNISQFSLLRSLSELLILKILVKRYPDLQRQQVSCHAAHEKEGRIYPCGNCEKCRRIIGMLKALDEDPQRCGYEPAQIDKGLKKLATASVKQIGSDASHLYSLLLDKGLIEETEHTKRLAKPYPHIMMMRFDSERSLIKDIPNDLRLPLFRIYSEYADGAARLVNKKWIQTDVFTDPDLSVPYPFELGNNPEADNVSGDYLWGEMSWPEIEEKLQKVDIAILPCGSIEQHGPHLPVDVDAFDAAYLARKVAEACSKPRPFVLPQVSYGVAYHHEDFKGTVSVTNDALSRLVYDIGMSLARNGIKKLVILNGHGDNTPTLNYAAQMINRDANIFVCVETGETSDEDLYKLIDTPND